MQSRRVAVAENRHQHFHHARLAILGRERVPGHRKPWRLRLALDADAPLTELHRFLRRDRRRRRLCRNRGEVFVHEPEDLFRCHRADHVTALFGARALA
jgi:hypothetical protein